MQRVPKVLLIGLDAAEPSLIREWAEAGYLPYLRRFLQAGAATDLASVATQFPDHVWHMIYTSRGPASLGRYYFIQPKPGTAVLEMLDDSHQHGEPFWITASAQGRRCVVIDPPKVGVGAPINGIQLSHWGPHSSQAPMTSHPGDFQQWLLATYGRHPVRNCDSHGRRARDYVRLRRQILAGVEVRGKLLRQLAQSESWDLFCAVFSETHCVGHQFWHTQDPQHPRYDAHDRHGLRTTMRDVYQAIDREIGHLLETVGSDTTALVFCGHGMRPQYHARDLIPALLERWGMRGTATAAPSAVNDRWRTVIHPPLLTRIQRTIPMPWQQLVKRALPHPVAARLMCRFVGTPRLDPAARAFYVPNNDLNASIRINLIGRDPFGRVTPGAEYTKLCHFLAARLRELINPATNRPAVQDVTLIDDLFGGTHRTLLPDITTLWSAEHSIDALYSPGYGTFVGAHNDLRSGGHAPTGLLAMINQVGEPQLQGAHIRDIAPTVLDLLDVPVPATMEGRSLIAAHTQRRRAV